MAKAPFSESKMQFMLMGCSLRLEDIQAAIWSCHLMLTFNKLAIWTFDTSERLRRGPVSWYLTTQEDLSSWICLCVSLCLVAVITPPSSPPWCICLVCVMHEDVWFLSVVSLSPHPLPDSRLSCHVNCWFSSLTCRHISSPAALGALSGEIRAWAVCQRVHVCVSACLFFFSVMMCR